VTPVVPVDPKPARREYIVGGQFNGTVRGTSAASGTLEVGYQVECVPNGMLAAFKRAVTQVQVLKEDLRGASPSAAVTGYHVVVDCMGPAVIRSYAILTCTTNGNDAVVAYYCVPTPA
jgi:MspA